jgi:hypothetical protein
MKAIDSLIATPAIVSFAASGEIWLRGRLGADNPLMLASAMPVSVSMGVTLLGLMCVSAAVLTVREMRAEAADAAALARLRADS